MTKPLKVGFIVDDIANVPAWYYQTIKEVEQRGHDIYFIVLQGTSHKNAKTSALYRLFRKFEDRWFRSEYDASKLISIEDLTKNKTFYPTNGVSLSASELNELKNLPLDILYAIDAAISGTGPISEVARYGLWYIRFGFGKYAIYNLPAFWEVMDDKPVTGSYLLIYKNGKTRIAYQGTTRTVPHSVRNNFNSIAWKSSSYLPFRLDALGKKRDLFLDSNPTIDLPVLARSKGPGNLKMLWLFLKNGGGYLRYKLTNRFNKDQFTILFSFTKFNLDNVRNIEFIPVALPSNDVFWADPFVVEREGIHYIFFEEMVYSKSKAHISFFTIDQNGQVRSPSIVLDQPYHLSYPFVFEYEGVFYMVPETASNRTVELYRATKFPDQWEFVMNLINDVVLMDVTLHFDKGKWWLFANSHNHPFVSTNDQLFLYYSDELFSLNWVSHPQNPIATHAENCRPAGRIFKENNKLYRPAQNNASQQYGYGLKINEIEVLDENSYKEKEVFSITPDIFGMKACHQLDFSSSIVVIDGIVKKD